ncbi:MAG: hypothetical protein GC172_08845 [Phycisphaera sp.]|nr:hypothetical protein [Phycisphaera sp.]
MSTQLSKAILATSAFAITAFAIVEAGRLHPEADAATAMIGVGGMTAITASVGQGPDEQPFEVLYIIDNRTETLFVYGVDSGGTTPRLSLRGGASIPALFRAARGG